MFFGRVPPKDVERQRAFWYFQTDFRFFEFLDVPLCCFAVSGRDPFVLACPISVTNVPNSAYGLISLK